MKKIVPFRKDIIFKNHIKEVTSISLEHTLSVSEDSHAITGEFIVSGDYLMTDESIHTEPFSYELPFDIRMDEKYLLSNVAIDIDDFYYEIVNDNVLSIHIDVLVDKLEEQLIPVQTLEEVTTVKEDILESDREFMLENSKEEEAVQIEECNEEPRCIEPEEEVEIKEDTIEDFSPSKRKKDVVEEMQEVFEEKQTVVEEKREMDASMEIQSIFDGVSSQTETYKSYKVYIVREGDDLELIMEKYHITKEELELYNDLKEIKVSDKIIIPCSYENA